MGLLIGAPMPISNEFAHLSPFSVIIPPGRQRSSVDTLGLLASVQQNGILNPIILTRDLTLVAGERRLQCALELGLPTVPVRFLDELQGEELQIIELEENLKRSNLPWRDEVRAIGVLHSIYSTKDPEWNQGDTSRVLSLSAGYLSIILRVSRDLTSPKISHASGLVAAYNALAKADARSADAALVSILEGGAQAFGGQEPTAQEPSGQEPSYQEASLNSPIPWVPPPVEPQPYVPPPIPPPVPTDNILCANFLEWAPTYTGPKFNFIHCDFPYGVNVFDGSQSIAVDSTAQMGHGGMSEARASLYSDTEEVYWELITGLCQNLDRLTTPSAHLMFWMSLKHYTKTLALFKKLAPQLVFNPMPLVWMKSDNRGILPDSKRGPRQIYETALLASLEDRYIIRPVSNAYAAPCDKQWHQSTKPEPVLRYFFGMLVDDTTRMLDPTCGSGSAIRAAESLGAKTTLGLEVDQEHCDLARMALRKFRALRGREHDNV